MVFANHNLGIEFLLRTFYPWHCHGVNQNLTQTRVRRDNFICNGRVVHVVLRALIPSFPVGPARRSLRNRHRAGTGFPTVLPPTARQLGSLQIPLGTPANSPGQSHVRNSICLSGPVTRSIISSTLVFLGQLGKVFGSVQPLARQISNNALAMFLNTAIAHAPVRLLSRHLSSPPLMSLR